MFLVTFNVTNTILGHIVMAKCSRTTIDITVSRNVKCQKSKPPKNQNNYKKQLNNTKENLSQCGAEELWGDV